GQPDRPVSGGPSRRARPGRRGSFGRRRQVALTEPLVTLDRIAMLAGRRRRAFGALEHCALAAARGLAAAQRMHRDAEDRAPRERADRDALTRGLSGTGHFDGPDDRLALLVAQHVLALLVHRREEDL